MGLTAERLRELLHYDAETGVFTRAVHWNNPKLVGTVAGSTRRTGYIDIKVCCRKFAAHRLAFLYMVGHWPPHDVDHINGVRGDNRWCNLRLATRAENSRNRRVSPLKKSALPKGITVNNGRFRARIFRDGSMIQLGYFPSIEAAEAAYKVAEALVFGPYARAA